MEFSQVFVNLMFLNLVELNDSYRLIINIHTINYLPI